MALRLSKWYLDLVADDGAMVIAYAARIRWRRLRLTYSATLEMSAAGQVTERTTLRQFQEPRWEQGALHWGHPKLGGSGTWRPLRTPTSVESSGHRLFENDGGAVDWALTSGRAEAKWKDERGPGMSGLGYMERLDLTLPPWDLPIDELYWGRFVAPDSDAVWIEWRGAHALRLVWRDGEPTGDVPILLAPEAQAGFTAKAAPPELGLSLSAHRLLRDGPLVSTVFSRVPVLKRALPARMLNATETKWLSSGTAASGARGWAIHEVVRW